MNITITITRNPEWVAAQRLARGENVPSNLSVTVSPSELSLEARAVVLAAGRGEYVNFSGAYGKEFRFLPYYVSGRIDLLVDSDKPTPAEISAAIVAADVKLSAMRAEHEERKAAAAAQEAERKAAAVAQEAACTAARELLEPEFVVLRTQVKSLQERLQEAQACRRELAEFLSCVTDDALEAALDSAVDSDTAKVSLRQRVEDASPVVIFADK